MPSKVIFALFDHSGAPLVGASPSVVVHARVTGGSLPLPVTVEKGQGFYEFELDPVSDGPSAYLVYAGPDSSARYLSGSVGECVGFALYDEEGEPDGSRSPQFLVYRDSDGNNIYPDPFVNLTGGLYAFWPFEELPGKSIYYVISDGLTTLSGTIGSTVVTNEDPPRDSGISNLQSISLDVLDSESELGRVLIAVEYPDLGGVTELVWDGDKELGYSSVTRVAVPSGWRYTIFRRGGWPSHPSVRVFVTNYGGREL